MVAPPSVKPIEFYFDFSSPYGYLASYRIDAIGEAVGREVIWRPYLLGAAFKATGQSPLVSQPLRGGYSLRDMERSARKLQVPLVFPDGFPMPTQAAGRAFYWLDASDPRRARDLAKALYRAAFAQGRNIAPRDVVADAVHIVGIDFAADVHHRRQVAVVRPDLSPVAVEHAVVVAGRPACDRHEDPSLSVALALPSGAPRDVLRRVSETLGRKPKETGSRV